MHDPGNIFLVSPINAILEGLYETPITLAELSRHGDFGIGTFNDLDGELLMVDGAIYRLDADGWAHRPAPEVCTPFAGVCHFNPYSVESVSGIADMHGFEAFLDRSLLSRNMMFAIRAEGRFARVRTRSVPLTANHTPLVEATALQRLLDLEDVEGTIVGFYTPDFMPSVNVPGYHFHFITADRSRGGHVLSCEIIKADVSFQICTRMTLNLPFTADYLGVEFTRDARGDIETAERAR